MDHRIPLERIFQGATLCATFLDYTFRSCLNCSSIRHRIAYRNHLCEDGIYVHMQGGLWIREKIKFENILKELELLNRRGPATRASQSYEGPNRVLLPAELEGHTELQLQIEVVRHIFYLLKFEVKPANDEQIDRSQTSRSENENEQQTVNLINANKNRNRSYVLYKAKNAIERSLQKLVAYKSRRQELPSHLKCRMFLNELIGRQSDGPMREIDMIALADKAIPHHIHLCLYAFKFMEKMFLIS